MEIKYKRFDWFSNTNPVTLINEFITENNIQKSDVINITNNSFGGVELWYWGEKK